MHSLFQELSSEELDQVKLRVTTKTCKVGERVFTAGDSADCIYFVDSGHISIFIEKFNTTEFQGFNHCRCARERGLIQWSIAKLLRQPAGRPH